MISYLKGKLQSKGKNYIIVVVGDVGYKVFTNPVFYAETTAGQKIELFTHQYVREDSLDLYGFHSLEELEMFELLLSISGVGPKSALGILSIAKVVEIKDSIARGDSHLLTKVSGIGRKTAERVILELREKIGALGFGGGATAGTVAGGDEIDALVTLGYSIQQARDALRQIDPKITDPSERIRQALKKLGK